MAKPTAVKGNLQFCSNLQLWTFRKELAECINREHQLQWNNRYLLETEQAKVTRGEISLQDSQVAYYAGEIKKHEKWEREYRSRASKVRSILEFRKSIGLA